ncbi:DUF4263 domain-containing protein [Mucilaginibacter daejeonensis]|uniref:Shedu anti-phage system protein SduA domain-containing protein n=1 Tax=Mucilaginibacter daejeonensis TaxID=398049 RepID=UPI001D179D88|nr:Shedu anti-phage system protein SduA domain-containing protein [Mucilaginibacter daejeonensis]UEG53432.1 DUF4263 domain-containing protein [Mucilaginibacter daejeonensis]
MNFKDLIQLVDDFIETGNNLDDLNKILLELYRYEDGLRYVIKLAVDDYGGYTYKGELQNVALLGALKWGIDGLKAIENITIAKQGYRYILNATSLLSHISSCTLAKYYNFLHHLECLKVLNLEGNEFKSTSWVASAKNILLNITTSVDKASDFPIGLVTNLQKWDNPPAQHHLFAAMLLRWFNLNSYGLEQFKEVISRKSVSEEDCHTILKNNPYIIEPFNAQVWSKPRFGAKLVPDFLIRSMDDTYTVIEIEKPTDPILTAGGELHSKATHAKRQALDFQHWVNKNNAYASQDFPNIFSPMCLVIIGLEHTLNDKQKERLKQENESTQGRLRIVGFDWIYNRAKATLDNLVNFGFEKI